MNRTTHFRRTSSPRRGSYVCSLARLLVRGRRLRTRTAVRQLGDELVCRSTVAIERVAQVLRLVMRIDPFGGIGRSVTEDVLNFRQTRSAVQQHAGLGVAEMVR